MMKVDYYAIIQCGLSQLDNKALVGVLNSKMGWWLINKFCTQIQNGCQLIWKYFGQIPIPELSNPNLLSSTEQMLDLQREQQSVLNKFIKYLQSQFSIEKLSKKPPKLVRVRVWGFYKRTQ